MHRHHYTLRKVYTSTWSDWFGSKYIITYLKFMCDRDNCCKVKTKELDGTWTLEQVCATRGLCDDLGK